MSELLASHLSELFGALRKASHILLQLRLAVLPQPYFIMLLDRTEELSKILNMIVTRKLGGKRAHERAGNTTENARTTRVVAAITPLLTLLSNLRESISADLKSAEAVITYSDYYNKLNGKKLQLRNFSEKIEKGNEKLIDENCFESTYQDLKNLINKFEELIGNVHELNRSSKKKVSVYCSVIEKLFDLLENNVDLYGVNFEVIRFLKEISYKNIVDAKIFDKQAYVSQIVDEEDVDSDVIRHYINQNKEYSPCCFFKDSYYIAAYPEVRQLRYNPLEHYMRYGEVLRLSPGPDFDATYYLENNDDILDANISPLRHFLLHGLHEGRQPSPKAGRYFAMRYLEKTAVHVAFVGEPEEAMRPIWDLMRSHCETRESGRVTNIPLEAWSGTEMGFDAIVIGEEAAAHLRSDIKDEIAKNDSRILYLGTHPYEDLNGLWRQDQIALERFCAVTTSYERFIRWQECETSLKLHYYCFEGTEKAVPFVESLLNSLGSGDKFSLRRSIKRKGDGPIISVVSIIYKKIKEMLAFLEALNRQDLAQPYEIVLVDDASPDDSVKLVEEWLNEKRNSGLLNKFMTVRILRNTVNSGNCSSRNRGVEAANSDIVLVVDGDVVLSASSLSEHVWAYRFDDCDAVIGFFKFNLDYDFVFHWLAACEVNQNIVCQHILRASEFTSEKLNMRSLPNSIFNFVTRNTSFRKSAFDGQYFDENFNYSSDKNSGYGEEDHELAALLYFDKKRIRFIDSSISVHIRHFDNSYNADKVIANLRNWNRLIDKHPDLMLVDRPYYQWRTCNLLGKAAGRPDAPEVVSALARYADPARAKISIPPARPLKILTYLWNVPSQYELFKLEHVFTVPVGVGTLRGDTWDYGLRPRPYNLRSVSLKDIDPNDYDLAILPFDERILFPEHGARISCDWGHDFQTMLEVTEGLPRIALCHEAPLLFRQCGQGNESSQDVLTRREAVRELLQNVEVVCDSYQAQAEWNFASSSVIWHGFSPQEFPEGSHERNCVTLSRDSLKRLSEHGGGKELLRVKELLSDRCTVEYMTPPPIHPGYENNTQEWAVANFQNYTAYIGTFKMHLAPFKCASMPRVRGEAMCAGVIPVTLRNPDVEMYIENGFNGYYGDSVEELVEHMIWLLRNERHRRKICANVRRTALDIFNIDRHLSGWSRLIHKVL